MVYDEDIVVVEGTEEVEDGPRLRVTPYAAQRDTANDSASVLRDG